MHRIALLVLTVMIARAEDLNSLGAYLGKWKGTGQSKDTAYSKAGTTEAETNCAWSANGGFLVCDQKVPTGEDLSIYSYNESDHAFQFVGLSRGSNRVRTLKLTIEGKHWTYQSEAQINGKRVQFRTVNEFTNPDTVTYKAEYSEDGEHWTTMSEGANRRIK